MLGIFTIKFNDLCLLLKTLALTGRSLRDYCIKYTTKMCGKYLTAQDLFMCFLCSVSAKKPNGVKKRHGNWYGKNRDKKPL